MIAFLIYQLKVTVIAAVLYLIYRLTLSKQTFHGFNRMMLLLIAALAFILPVCQVGSNNLVNDVRNVFHITPDIAISSDNTVSAINNTVSAINNTVVMPSEERTSQMNPVPDVSEPEPAPLNKFRLVCIILFAVWCIGFIWVSYDKLKSLISVRKVIKSGRYADRQDECDVIENDDIAQPMNWMNYVMMPREWLKKENAAVWKHEMSHAHKAHSIDLLLIDMMQLFQWFNPVMYLLQKELEMIHEYQADRAVLESGADARQYKLMLVQAVAESRGYAMTSWLRQTNLKKRIDMMQKKESNRWNRLRALFIPLFAVMFAILNTAMSTAQDKNFQWPAFEDGKTWIYPDGSAKVQTFDGVTANMKADEVPGYLAKYKGVKTTRMTLRYIEPVKDLSTVYPLARKLADKGIHINVANNDEMLTRMTMPEFRCPAIYDLGGGQFKFEMNCENEDNSTMQTFVRMLTMAFSEMLPDSLKEMMPESSNPSVTGDLNLMLDWVDVFDGHGIAIFAKDMTTAQVDKISKAAFKRGIDQVSLVTDTVNLMYNIVTIIPKNFSFEKNFGNIDAFEAVHKLQDRQISDYESKGLVIENPKIFYDPLQAGHSIREVINTPEELILVASYNRPKYQWVIGYKDAEIEVNGVRYKATKTEGMEGFEDNYFWSPTMGIFVQTLHFPPIPKDVKTIDFYDCSPTNTKKMIQVAEDDSFMSDVRSIKLDVQENLKTTHINDDVKDYFRADRVDFFEDKTVVNCLMHTHAAHSVPGHVGSDFTLTLGNGKVVKALGIEGVPADQDFDRHGDWIRTPFQVVFPVITEEEWNSTDGTIALRGSILHEPMTLTLNAPEPEKPSVAMVPVTSIEKGKYHAAVAKREKMKMGDMDLGWMPKETFEISSVSVGAGGIITVEGDPTNHIADGVYTLKVIEAAKEGSDYMSLVELVSAFNSVKFEAYRLDLGETSIYTFNTPTEINGVPVDDSADVWTLSLTTDGALSSLLR
ncbi:MAG: hypothetical protein J5869_02845 [Bacteroidaceae bacterium]|nr:hypothetical protein [Bacteroidaceae bacterium]